MVRYFGIGDIGMRIIGGYDYYDTVGGYQNDDTRTFIRQKPYSYETKDTHEYVKLSLPRAINFYRNFLEDVSSVEVIFCGKYYFGLCLYKPFTGSLPTRKYIWSFEHFQELVSSKEIEYVEGRYYYYSEDKAKFNKKLKELFVRKNYSPEKELIDNEVVIATRYSTDFPEFRDHENVFMWSKNPSSLKDINFASVVPPWEAYQEIEMYLGTILVNDKSNMVTVSDKVKARKYGFDEWSFRNKIHPAKPRGA
jgi:hypothetical protein